MASPEAKVADFLALEVGEEATAEVVSEREGER